MSVELTIKGLTKKFGKDVAVEDLSITVERAELLAFLGPSRAGKTTTLNLVAGLEKPDGGDILMDGQSILDLKPSERDFAMVFESMPCILTSRSARTWPFPCGRLSGQTISVRRK